MDEVTAKEIFEYSSKNRIDVILNFDCESRGREYVEITMKYYGFKEKSYYIKMFIDKHEFIRMEKEEFFVILDNMLSSLRITERNDGIEYLKEKEDDNW